MGSFTRFWNVLLLASAWLVGYSDLLAAQTTPGPAASGVAPVSGPGAPTPAATASGWSDLGVWGIFGIAVIAAVVLVLLFHRRRRSG